LGQGETHSPTMVREAAVTTPKEDSEDDSSWVPIVLSGVGGICLLCGLVAFFVVRRRSIALADVFNKEGCEIDAIDVPILNESVPSGPLPPIVIAPSTTCL